MLATETWEWVVFGLPWQVAAVVAAIGIIVVATFGKDDR